MKPDEMANELQEIASAYVSNIDARIALRKAAELLRGYDQALLTARNQGRDEGLEEAAALAGADNRSEMAKQQGHKPRWHQYGMAIAATIRAKIGEHGNG